MNPSESTKRSHHKKKPQSSGVGESRVFAADPGEFPEDKRELTVDGLPIPDHLRALVPYSQTDQGRAENNAGKERAHVQFLRDSDDKAVDHYRDDLLDDVPLLENHDPLRVIMDRHLPPGMRGLMMSKKKCDKEGMRRGVLDYEPVMVERDGKKEMVEHAGMFLAAVPEKLARRADKHYADKAKAQQVNAIEKVQEAQDTFMSEAQQRKIDRRGRGEYGGLQQESGEQVMAELTHEFAG